MLKMINFRLTYDNLFTNFYTQQGGFNDVAY